MRFGQGVAARKDSAREKKFGETEDPLKKAFFADMDKVPPAPSIPLSLSPSLPLSLSPSLPLSLSPSLPLSLSPSTLDRVSTIPQALP